ncbi:hypothetical protein HYV50_02485 [Candidatus Pacearchaeota archaeon]|nr:hypothetical protein [Candidatus Pacearchaeota archaeon]
MNKKIRVNITVDRKLLNKARKKLNLFGGKLSTLFNSYLNDFIKSMEEIPGKNYQEINEKLKEIEMRIRKLEEKHK